MNESTIIVLRKGSDRIDEGLPWIYRSDVKSSPSTAPEGAIVRVVDQRGWFKGRAFWSTKSQIALRMLTRDDALCDRNFFKKRLLAAKALREMTFPGNAVYRLVHGDADLLSGVVIDRYGSILVMQLLSQGADRIRDLLVDVLREIFPEVTAIVERSDAKVRMLEGLPLVKKVLFGKAPGPVDILEGDVIQRVDPMDGQKTGGFLDQRENHILAANYATGEGLDCFSYTGGFAFQLAKHGCRHVTAVEISESASELIRQGAQRNGLNNVSVVTTNVFDFLKAETLEGHHYDTVVLDPPSFAKNKASIDSALRGYKEINLRGMQLVKPGGILISASCSFHVDEYAFEEMLCSAAMDARRSIQIIEKRGAGRDHPVHLGVRETRYLKCFFLRMM